MKEVIVFTIIMITVWLLLHTVVNAVELSARVEESEMRACISACGYNLD